MILASILTPSITLMAKYEAINRMRLSALALDEFQIKPNVE